MFMMTASEDDVMLVVGVGRGTAEESMSTLPLPLLPLLLLLLLSSSARGSSGKKSEFDDLDRELCPAGSSGIVIRCYSDGVVRCSTHAHAMAMIPWWCHGVHVVEVGGTPLTDRAAEFSFIACLSSILFSNS